MEAAIAEFPNIIHRICHWHVVNKIMPFLNELSSFSPSGPANSFFSSRLSPARHPLRPTPARPRPTTPPVIHRPGRHEPTKPQAEATLGVYRPSRICPAPPHQRCPLISKRKKTALPFAWKPADAPAHQLAGLAGISVGPGPLEPSARDRESPPLPPGFLPARFPFRWWTGGVC